MKHKLINSFIVEASIVRFLQFSFWAIYFQLFEFNHFFVCVSNRKCIFFLSFFSLPFFSIEFVAVSYVLMTESNNVRKTKKDRRVQKLEGHGSVLYEASLRGNRLLHFMGHKYIRNNVHGNNIYWKCTKWHNGCKARAITNAYDSTTCSTKNVHNHDELMEIKFSQFN